jgi:hypothetical protein
MKVIQVTMGDGSVWEVPAESIATNRARYYAERDTGTTSGTEFDEAFDNELAVQDGEDIIDWAQNNTNWSDVQGEARMVKPPNETDFQDGWVNGDMRIVEREAVSVK